MDALIIRGLTTAQDVLTSMLTSGGSKFQDVSKDPKKFNQFIWLLLFWHIAIVTVLALGMTFTEWGRKKLRKYWKLSQQGPFHRLVVWIAGLFVRAFVSLMGDRMVEDPSECKPRFTTIQTQVNRIVLHWTAKRSSKWTDDTYELQILRSSPRAGGLAPLKNGSSDKASVEGWEEIYTGPGCEYDCCDLPEDRDLQFRVRTFNKKGSSAWCEAKFRTRQRPIINGGTGPGYQWHQTTKEVQVVIVVSGTSKSKDFEVSCKGGVLRVLECGKPLVDGELWKPVKGSELSWSLGTSEEEGLTKGKKVMFLTLEKMDKTNRRKNHWTCVIKGHPLLDSRFLPDCIIPSGRMPDETEI